MRSVGFRTALYSIFFIWRQDLRGGVFLLPSSPHLNSLEPVGESGIWILFPAGKTQLKMGKHKATSYLDAENEVDEEDTII